LATMGTHRSTQRSRQRLIQLGTAVGVLVLVATAGAASAEEPLPLPEDPVLASVVSQLFVAGEAPILLAAAYDYENPPSSKGDVESYSYNGGYIFGMTRGARALGRRMQDAWVQFARTGNPEHDKLPAWQTYEATRRSTMILGPRCYAEDRPLDDERSFWEGRLDP